MITLTKTCHLCKTEHEMQVSDQSLERFQKGEHVQFAFPYLTADERELLISGICGKCVDEIFAEVDDTE